MPRSSLVSYLTLAALLPAVGISCKPERGESREATARPRAASMQTQDPPADPCNLLPVDDVERALGPLSGPGKRARSAESPVVDPEGSACVYTLATPSPRGSPLQVSVQLVLGGASLAETGFGMVKQAIAQELNESPSATAEAERAGANAGVPDTGWDYKGGVPGLWVGRIGHVGVHVGVRGGLLARAKTEQLAARIRDRIPDLPVAVPLLDPNEIGTGNDPCALVNTAEVEAILGKLPVRPYRSRESTPFADGTGTSCSYYRGHHRALILTPTWSDAQTQFRMAAGLGQGISAMLGVGEQSADTLDGPWDQATGGVDGRLYFLKGDRMLEMDFKSSGVDAATAIRLATAAVQTLTR